METINEFIEALNSKAKLEKERAFYDAVRWNRITEYGAYCRKLELEYRQLAEWLKELKALKQQQPTDAVDRVTIKEYLDSYNGVKTKLSSSENPNKWIPVSERLPEVNEEAYSNDVLISLKRTIFDTDKCQMVHITKIAFYDENAISSDGRYMDTEGWVLGYGGTLSMDEVIAWMPLPEPYKQEVEE